MALSRTRLSDAKQPPAIKPVWHATSADDAEAHLATHRQHGLSADEVARRLAVHGPNALASAPRRPAWRRILDQLTAPLVLVLIAAGSVTLLLGEWVDSSVIFGVVAINAVLGYWQEAKAEGALAALARSVATPVVAMRDGQRHALDATALVPGDVVHLAAGDRVPADLRIFHAHSLQTDESGLTGESTPVGKHADPLPHDTQLADRLNMAYAGSTVVAGKGAGFVIGTGSTTETGRIAGLIAGVVALETPLTRKMARFSNWLLWGIGGLALLTFVIGMARGESAYAMFIAAVALAVGAIPEGLPAAVTITLAIGVARMAKRRAIIRHLPAVETLGSTTVICSDKTGTLTENAMTVRALWGAGKLHAVSGQGYDPAGALETQGGAALEACLRIGALCNDAALHQVEGRWEITGDPTEAALLVVARKAGLDEQALAAAAPRIDELPFDAKRQYMATLHADGELLLKGAIERLLPLCTTMLDANGSAIACNPALIEAMASQLAGEGMRVLLLARSSNVGAERIDDALLQGLTVAGLVAMIDPPRSEAIAAVRACQAAGIQVKMITGDHVVTARAIATQLGIPAERALTGRELAALGDPELATAAQSVCVFARVEPEQKLRLVQALQAQGEVVAMTGDGVNDAPALKAADIGIAMGRGGTEVAKEAAAMVLTDDNFASIEAAVEEGRGVWDNLVKFITWTLPTNFGEGLVILTAIVLGITLPITPLQILWINMTTAVLLGLMLAFEPIEPGVMARPPRQLQMPVLNAGLVRRIILVSLLLLGGAFGLFLLELEQGHSLAEARTVAVNVFVLVETVYLFNCRSLTRSLWSLGVFSNPWAWAGAATMIGLQLLLTYWPPLSRLFQTAPIGLEEWGRIGAVAVLAFFIIGLEKRLASVK